MQKQTGTPTSTDETEWLCEVKDEDGVPSWYCLEAPRTTPDASKALRFAREVDAAKMSDYCNENNPPNAFKFYATEHMWMGPPNDGTSGRR